MIRGFRVEGTFRSIQAMPNVYDLLPGEYLGQLQFSCDEGTVVCDEGDRPVTAADMNGLMGRPIRLTVEVLDG